MMTASLSVFERELILVCLRRDPRMPWAEIGRRVGRDPRTISREVARNGGPEAYSPAAADARAAEQRKRPRLPKLVVDTELAAVVASELEAGFSPAAVAVRIRVRGYRVSHETIYQGIYTGLLDVDPTRCLRSRRPRRRRRGDRQTTNPTGAYLGSYVPIHQRPAHIENRSEVGHWEGDLVFGTRGATAIGTLIERRSYLTVLLWLPHGRNTRSVTGALDQWASTLPADLRGSLTWDQGAELTNWPDIVDHFTDGIFFCDRRAPWQRARNEQNNRILRFWFPHGAPLHFQDDSLLRHVETILNNQPRRSLDWLTPNQAYHALTRH